MSNPDALCAERSRTHVREAMREWLWKKNGDLWSSLFLMVLAGLVIREALELEVGTPTNPGSGFMVCGAAAALGLLALHQCVRSLAARAPATESAVARIRWSRIVAVVSAILLYILALRPVGYLVCTFLLLSFLFQVLEHGHWVARTIGAAMTAFATYVIFAKMLQLNLPRGLLTFY
jgi:putative tricarboxylic transport membrane protein